MELINGWARMNSSMERPRKKRLQRKPRRQILRSSICIEQTGSESAPLTRIYFTCLQSRGSHNPLTENNTGLKMSQVHMRLGQNTMLFKLHHKDSQHHCGIKHQANFQRLGFDQNVDLAFPQCRCNFRLALKYFNSFLFSLCANLQCQTINDQPGDEIFILTENATKPWYLFFFINSSSYEQFQYYFSMHPTSCGTCQYSHRSQTILALTLLRVCGSLCGSRLQLKYVPVEVRIPVKYAYFPQTNAGFKMFE